MIRFSAPITVQYDAPFTIYGVNEWKYGLDWIKESGMDGAEINIGDYDTVSPEKLASEIKNELDKRGLLASTISTGQSAKRDGLRLTGGTPEILKRTQERLCQHIDAASVLSCCITIGSLKGKGDPDNHDAEIKELREALLPVVDYAEKKNVTILLEAINRYETALLNTAAEVRTFITDELGDPACVKVLYDLFHANIEEKSITGGLHILGPKLGHVHIADSNRAFPGFGHIDFEDAMSHLRIMDFDGYASFECLCRPSAAHVHSHTATFIARMREIAQQ